MQKVMHAEGKALTYRQIRQMLRSYSKGEPCSMITAMQTRRHRSLRTHTSLVNRDKLKSNAR